MLPGFLRPEIHTGWTLFVLLMVIFIAFLAVILVHLHEHWPKREISERIVTIRFIVATSWFCLVWFFSIHLWGAATAIHNSVTYYGTDGQFSYPTNVPWRWLSNTQVSLLTMVLSVCGFLVIMLSLYRREKSSKEPSTKLKVLDILTAEKMSELEAAGYVVVDQAKLEE